MTEQPACTLLFLRHNDQLLLAMKKRGHGAGNWNGVGGKIKPGESVEDALVRECEEEIGVTPTAYHKVALIDFVTSGADRTATQKVHVFIGDEWQGEPREAEEMAPQWFTVNTIPYEHMWEDDALWLPLVLRGKKLQCSLHFDNKGSVQSAHFNVVEKF